MSKTTPVTMGMIAIYCPACGKETRTQEETCWDFVILPGGYLDVTCDNCWTPWRITFEFKDITDESPTTEKGGI